MPRTPARLALAFGLAAASWLSTASAAPPAKVLLCHYNTNTQTYSLVNVNSNALNGHFGHGDVVAGTYYADADGDGYGDANGTTDPCPNPGFVSDASDCNDSDATINPAATEVCNDGLDNNCSGEVDEGCLSCPCFSTADLDQGYADWQGIANQGWDDYRLLCNDVRYPYSFAYNYIYVNFYARRSSDGHNYQHSFYNWGMNDESRQPYCVQAKKSGGTSGYDWQTHKTITYAEHAQCQTMLRQWISANGIACQVIR